MNIRRLLRLASTVVFLDTVMFAAITPLLPSYVEDFALSNTDAGILIAAYPAGTFLAALPAIWFAKRFGVRSTVFLGLALLGASTVAFALSGAAWQLEAARLAQGFSGAFSWGGALGWLIGSAPAESRGETIGYALAAALFGAMLGPVLGGAAVELSAVAVFLTVAGLALALALFTLTVPRPQRPTVPEVRHIPRALGDRRVKAGLWIVLLFGMCYGAVETLAPLQMDAAGLSGGAIALVFIGPVAIEAVLAPVIGRATDRRGRLAPLKLCLPLAVGVMLAFGWAATAPALVALVALCGVAIGPMWTPGTALFSDGAEDAGVDHVVSFSLSNVAWALGGLSGAYLAGALSELSGEPAPYSLMAAFCAATLVWVVRFPRSPSGLTKVASGSGRRG